MAFFGLFKKKKKIILHDELFGEIRFLDFGKHDSYFESKVNFSPDGHPIDCLIPADESGPTEHQRAFYRQLQQNYPAYTEKVKHLIEEEFRHFNEEFIIVDFSKELELEHIRLPQPEKPDYEWELAFSSVHDDNHLITIGFIGEEPDEVHIDG
ncbi:hypothetical protein [uncultured Chitinophaga sp.]|uniref:hypothetical protein n=1 Tax=uncultured Chitinophaga sp. TaxID=339340 RepID=UPI0025D59086|nr:hypothetical protein [uncultured Chitinophaga sp.]